MEVDVPINTPLIPPSDNHRLYLGLLDSMNPYPRITSIQSKASVPIIHHNNLISQTSLETSLYLRMMKTPFLYSLIFMRILLVSLLFALSMLGWKLGSNQVPHPYPQLLLLIYSSGYNRTIPHILIKAHQTVIKIHKWQ